MNIICSFSVAGPSMPKKLYGHTLVTMGYDAIVLGGFNILTDGISAKLFKFSCSNNVCEWEQLSKELKMPRHRFIAVPLPDDFVECN